ncbi:MAG: phosphomannomutase/phosphoglucomutase [Anaerolinea sp.]|nr:phosphomannomutase/phosphoglucomutase [Anaerolinea sp.]
MVSIDAKLFKKYDIRGKADGAGAPLTPQAARLIGRAFGTYMRNIEERRTVVVGRDNRHSSVALMDAAMHGLTLAGCDVIDIALTSTPLVYWQAVKRNNAGGMMVTGSHLAPDQNGFKLSVGGRNIYGDGIQEILRLIETGQFASGSGSIDCIESVQDYFSDIVPRIRVARPLKLVVDAGNGTAGMFAPKLLRTFGHNVTELFCDTDGSFPNHLPDPRDPATLTTLGAKVREIGADVGITFDGDANRIGVVDEQGNVIAADRLLALLARDLLKRHPGATVVADVLSSQALFDAAAAAGGIPVMCASGCPLIKAKMAEVGALLGGEMSGHIFIGEDYYGFDDAYLAAGRLLQVLAANRQPLSALSADIPMVYSTPEYRPRCPDERKEAVIDGVSAILANKGEAITVDGIRVKFERGWGLLRASNTDSVLSLRFEGETEADALAYRDLFFAALQTFPEVEVPAL